MKKGRLKVGSNFPWSPSAVLPTGALLLQTLASLPTRPSEVLSPAWAAPLSLWPLRWKLLPAVCLAASQLLGTYLMIPQAQLPRWKCLREGEGSSLRWQAYK